MVVGSPEVSSVGISGQSDRILWCWRKAQFQFRRNWGHCHFIECIHIMLWCTHCTDLLLLRHVMWS